MLPYMYRTKGVCSSLIEIELDGNVVKSAAIRGGCDGNGKGVARLVVGMTVEEVQKKLSGVTCGFRNTSCPDQLAKAVMEAYKAASVNA